MEKQPRQISVQKTMFDGCRNVVFNKVMQLNAGWEWSDFK